METKDNKNPDNIKEIKYKGYDTDAQQWENYIKTYIGGEDYINGGFLFKKPAEPEPRFKERVKRAYLINYAEMLVNTVVKYIFSADTKFQIDIPDELKPYEDKFDGQNSISEFFRKHLPYALAYGKSYIEITVNDKINNEIIQTQKDLQETGNIYKARFISPDKLIYYPAKEDEISFAWIKETLPVYSVFEAEKELNRVKILTPDEILIYKKESTNALTWKLSDTIENKFYKTPLIPFYPKGNGESLLKDAWRTQKSIFNLYSDLQKTFESLYPVLAVHQDIIREQGGDVNIEKAVGFPDGDSIPRWIESPVNYTNSVIETINLLITELLRQVGLSRANRTDNIYSVESGRAKELEFASTSELLALIASEAAKVMELCLECIGRALGISEEKIEVTAPKDFNVTSLQDEIALNISLLQAGGLGSGKLVKALKERIVKKLGFSKEDTKAINNELSEDPVNQSPYLGAV